MKKCKSFATYVFICLLCVSCASSTHITASWVAPEAKNQPHQNKRVFIAAITRNMELRNKLETALAAQAAKRGITPIKSSDYFSPDFLKTMPTEEQMAAKMKDVHPDAILTVSLIKKESENRYVPGSTGFYSPFPRYHWYGGFYSYYNYWYPYMYDPGYYVTDKTYFMETNLYDAATKQLVWSAQSTTVNPGSIDNFVKDYPQKVVNQMIKDGLIKS